MREIKFRALDVVHKIWRYSDIVGLPFFFEQVEKKRYINICEYTGLKDKRSREIYAGDILRYKCNNGYDISDVPLDPIDWFIVFCFGHTHVDTEIIGNIYKNPELLNKKG